MLRAFSQDLGFQFASTSRSRAVTTRYILSRRVGDQIPAKIIDVPEIYGVSREGSSAKLFHIDFQVEWPVRHRCPHAMSPQTHCGFQALIYARPAVSALSAWRLGPLTRLTSSSYGEVALSMLHRRRFLGSAGFYRKQILRIFSFTSLRSCKFY